MTRGFLYFAIMAGLLLIVGIFQSPNLALNILNLCLISAIMSLGVNIQWGYAGLFNVGVMGFAAMGGLAVVLISAPPVQEAWAVGGGGLLAGVLIFFATIAGAAIAYFKMPKSNLRMSVVLGILAGGYILLRIFFDPTTDLIEKVEPAKTGYLGGLGLPVLLAWPVGGLFAGVVAWIVGKITLGLRSDYLAIATLGISEIIVAVLKHEDWLTRGVKNVNGLPRPVPYETDLQQSAWFIEFAQNYGLDPVTFSSILVKLSYALLFTLVLLLVMWLSERALNSPWGRMMRAIRDNEVSSNAMGKDVTTRHLQVFVIGSIVVGIAGAMLTTLDGQLTPTSYQPLRFTFLIWVMVIVGGSGNNWGSVLGGFLVWFVWIEAEPVGLWLIEQLTFGLEDSSDLKVHLINSAAHMRLMTMGIILLLVLRFSPRGLIPERTHAAR